MKIKATPILPIAVPTSQPSSPPSEQLDRLVSGEPKLPSWPVRQPLQAVAGAVAGGAVGAGLGSLLNNPVATALGGAVGLAIGAVLGNSADHIGYSLQAKGRELENRVRQAGAELSGVLNSGPQNAALKPLGPQDLRAAQATGKLIRTYDGCDSSRDIAALYSAEQGPTEPYRFDVEVAHLRPAAEQGRLDTTLLISWGEDKGSLELPAPLRGQADAWKLAVQIDNDKNSKLVGAPEDLSDKAGELVQSRHSTVFNRIEVSLDKAALRAAGWKDGQPLRLQAVTSVDGSEAASSQIKAASNDKVDTSKIFRWEGKTVYYAVTDRFNNGDPSNDGPHVDKSSPDRFHGGDWQGVIDKLDYLKELNVDCVWLSPPYEQKRDFTNVNGWTGDGFHGYWPTDFTKPEPNWGDRAKLKELVTKAHEKGMKVMLDVVLNHTGYEHPFTEDPSKKDWFHDNGNISGLGQWSMENQALAGLPDLAQENEQVSHYLMEVHKDWLQDVDAFRIDAIRHMPEKFLRDFNQKMHEEKPDFYSVGEAFWLNSNFVAGYQNRTTDSMFDFPLAYAVRRTFAGDESRTLKDRIALYKELKPHASQTEAYRMLLDGHKSQSMKLISDVLNNDSLYDNPAKLGTFIDNHDMVRFASDIGGDERRLEGALAFLFAVRGTPHVYYGTEVGMTGLGPSNRDDMKFDSNPEMTASYKKLSGARHNSQALQNGSQQELFVGTDTYAFSRIRPEEEVVCVFNKGEEAQTLSFPLNPESPILNQAHQDGQSEPTLLKDMFGGEDITVVGDTVTVTLPPRGYTYLQWKAPVES